MSNGTQFVYTPDQTVAHFDQFSKAMELTRERQRRPELVTQALQVIIGNEDIITAPKMITTPTGKLFHVTSDGKIRSAVAAINALDCPVKWGLEENPAQIPMIIQPVDCNARLVTLGKVTTTEEVYRLYPKIVTPGELFAFGAKFPNEQLQGPIFTVWLDASGQFFYAILDVDGGKRNMGVLDDHPGDEWSGDCRALVRE